MSLFATTYRFPAGRLPRDPIGHPHIVIHEQTRSPEYVLVYGTSGTTEKDKGAATFEHGPIPAKKPYRGLKKKTHFHPGILVAATAAQVHGLDPACSVLAEIAQLEAALEAAIGRGSGCYLDEGVGKATLRGTLVELRIGDPRLPAAVVLTSHEFSLKRSAQIVVPVAFLAATGDANPEAVRLSAGGHLATRFGKAGLTAYALPTRAMTVRHPNELRVDASPALVTTAEIERLEDMVMAHFALAAKARALAAGSAGTAATAPSGTTSATPPQGGGGSHGKATAPGTP